MEIVKKNLKKIKIYKLEVNTENYIETFNHIRYHIKVEAVTIAKF